MLKKSNHILILSSYPPRECGIATFTQDLTNAFNKKFNPVVKTEICALNDRIYNYNSNVAFQIDASRLESYVALAKKINSREDIKLINIQHEFGLFGGEFGDYLIPFLQALEKPVIVTFHTVISKPEKKLKEIVKTIVSLSRAAVVMNHLSENLLEKKYGIPPNKINYIPHGIPQVSYEVSQQSKKALGYEGKIVLSTFGLINKNKGIEYVIRALPKIVQKYPNIVYLVIGETHPNIKKRQGEKYRNFLLREVKKLKLENNVIFYNKYLPLDEIIQFLKASDIYISSCIDKEQSVSGTLSYALGCGRATISTATEYAKHIINGKNGLLVKFKDPSGIAKEIIDLISNEKERKLMQIKAYKDTRPMIWPNVAESYFKLYRKFAELEAEENKLPEIKFDHILKMTDNFGIIQHASYTKPDKRFGYSLDDVSRALILCAMHYKSNPSEQLRKLMGIYIRFIKYARKKDGSFANIISYKRKKDKILEEDVQGRTIWALGYVSSQDYLPQDFRKEAFELFNSSIPVFGKIKAPRSTAFAILGLCFYLKAFPKSKNLKKILQDFSYRLIDLYKKNSCPEWQWFEDGLTYSNSKLPEALFCAYGLLKDKDCLKFAKSSLSFLESITFGPYYMPIGQKGWYFKNKQRSHFDQQPEDAASMVQTEVLAYRITKNKKYLKNALKAFQWFLGKNYLSQMVYDESTGGCNDGLGEYELNLNQGAESTICYAMARLLFEEEDLKSEIIRI